MIWLIYLVVFCIFILVKSLLNQLKRPKNYPPGPNWLPFVGNTPLIKKLSKELSGQHNAFSYLANKYKTNVLGLKLGSDFVVIVLSKDLVKEVFLREEMQNRPTSFFSKLRSMFTNKGITMTNGRLWHEQRNFVLAHLKQLGLGRNIMESFIIDELKDILNKIESESQCSALISNMSLFVLNVLWGLAAGSRFSHDDSRLKKLLNVFNERRKALDVFGGLLNQMPWLRFIAPNKTGYNYMCKVNEELGNILKEAIDWHKETLNTRKSDDLMYLFLEEMEAQKGTDSTFTEDQLLMVCVDLFIAGAETTSNTLAFALLAMVLNPHIQQKVQSEIKSVLGSSKIPNMRDRTRMPYVEAVLLESQRYMHVVPLAGPRQTSCDTTLNGYSLPKGTIILSSLLSIHHDKKRWSDPEIFQPERFLNENEQFIVDEPLLQFGLGKRRCLGEVLARNFIFIFFTGILRNYSLQEIPGENRPSNKPIPGITLAPQPCNVRFVPYK
uniref:Cytochrome P450 n=1 Tax=Clastoptera arizonana TaxID=38151 RepID=A0A1B6BXF9_9HEMI